jgi:hypothetical protein
MAGSVEFVNGCNTKTGKPWTTYPFLEELSSREEKEVSR